MRVIRSQLVVVVLVLSGSLGCATARTIGLAAQAAALVSVAACGQRSGHVIVLGEREPRDPAADGARCVELTPAVGAAGDGRPMRVTACDGRVIHADPETGVWAQ
jgi:hypothetical protein